jgi:hypothetical protein
MMLTSSERRSLERLYRQPIDARAVLAKCAAGLLIVTGIAAIGVATSNEDQSRTASVTGPQAASDR